MKNPKAVAFVVCAGALALSACGATKATAPSAPAATADEPNTVVMHLIAYQPEVLTVAPGTTVTWSQHDAGFHTVTSGTVEVEASGNILTTPDGKFASAKLAQSERFTFAFPNAGTYSYFCEIHPATMRGRIQVG